MNTTYDNGTEMHNLDAIEIIDFFSAENNKPMLDLIKHVMGEQDYTIHVSVTQPLVIVHLNDYDGSNIKIITFRRWHNGYCGAQVVGGVGYAYTSCGSWINLA